MRKKHKKYIFFLVFVFFAFFVFSAFFVYRFSEAQVNPNSVSEKRKQLEAELADLEKQIEVYRSAIKDKQKDAATFERDIAILNAKINKAFLEIKARQISIGKLNENIYLRLELISNYSDKISSEKLSLAEFIRRINELDDTSLVELVLKYENLSDFFIEFDTYDTLQAAMRESLVEIKGVKTKTEKEKEELEIQKNQELELKAIQEMQKKRIEEDEGEKKQLLKTTRGEEKKYQNILDESQKKAAQIRTALFMLRGSPAIPFEKALEYANFASQKTGVRPAFLLGVIAEESNLGQNVGTGNWKEDLSHENCGKQRTAFLSITAELGLDPDIMPVSKRAWYGYCGGAMGPAQFMPTTWQLYKKIVSNLTGNNPSNPWNPLDAFTASALLLKDNGAAAGGYDAEWRAAMRYLAGSNWQNPSYKFYGDDVMALAKKYQDQIDILESL